MNVIMTEKQHVYDKIVNYSYCYYYLSRVSTLMLCLLMDEKLLRILT